MVKLIETLFWSNNKGIRFNAVGAWSKSDADDDDKFGGTYNIEHFCVDFLILKTSNNTEWCPKSLTLWQKIHCDATDFFIEEPIDWSKETIFTKVIKITLKYGIN